MPSTPTPGVYRVAFGPETGGRTQAGIYRFDEATGRFAPAIEYGARFAGGSFHDRAHLVVQFADRALVLPLLARLVEAERAQAIVRAHEDPLGAAGVKCAPCVSAGAEGKELFDAQRGWRRKACRGSGDIADGAVL